ncbi:hypothetical protein ACFX2J_025446 [Malus domestica]
MWILKLSYDDLPYYLKLCSLYLAHFPEDSSIPVKRLTQLWMAEGLVPFTQLRPAGSLETMEMYHTAASMNWWKGVWFKLEIKVRLERSKLATFMIFCETCAC